MGVLVSELFIKGIRLNVRVGVYEHEKLTPQTVLVDCRLKVADNHSEDLSSVVDYESLVQEIKSKIEPQTFNLIETLSDKIYDICMSRSISWAEVCVTKKFYQADSVSYKRCSKD